MRTLHVAALPFPSQQGTQALLHVMLDALSSAGHDTHLLCYADAAFDRDTTYAVHRIPPDRARVSFRSGPSLRKLKLDARLAQRLPTLLAKLRPDAVIAHHVEAAAIALCCTSVPVLFIAHTSLCAELPSYFANVVAPFTSAAGRALDDALCRRVDRVLTVSPHLAELLARQSGVAAYALSVPWPIPRPLTNSERALARARLALSPEQRVLLYAGNLDQYQGLEPLLKGLAQLDGVRLVIATQSPHAQVSPLLRRLHVSERVSFAPLADEADRRAAHAACDLALVPRACEGGISIKLLDALARGVPVIAAERAAAGFPVHRSCQLIDGAAPHAWSRAIAAHLRQRSRALSDGPTYIATQHGYNAFVAQLAQHVSLACESHAHTRAGFFRRVIGR